MREPFGGKICYSIDGDDRLISFDDAWDQAASDADCAAMANPTLVGATIWDFIAGDECRDIYRLILDRVRKTGQPAHYPYRCDTAHFRRTCGMTIMSLDGETLEFQTWVIRAEKRTPVPLVNPRSPRGNWTVRMCSFCKKIAVDDNRWEEVEKAATQLSSLFSDNIPHITYSVCPSCKSNAERWV